MAENQTVRAEDVYQVGSRLSWGAILAGAVVALASHMILSLLGGAIGLTVSDDVTENTFSTGAAIWAVVTTALALFIGGWVTTQCAVGENKAEAVIHGVIMWGVMLGMILWLVGAGLSTGFNAITGFANVASAAMQDPAGNWEEAARQAGVSQATIDEWRRQAASAPAQARQAVEDPANRQRAAEMATQATWWTLGGTLLSMAAAIGGALLGAGPTFRLFATPIGVARGVVETHQYVRPEDRPRMTG